MLYGISGASRSGKTTVMKAVAERIGFDYKATSVAKVIEARGVDLKAPMTLKERLALQIAILEDHIEDTHTIIRPTILDRTPLDMLAYTYAEFGMASHLDIDDSILEMVQRYATMCREHIVQNYSCLFTLRPLPDGVYEEGAFKPSPNPVYHAHFQAVLEGLLNDFHDQIPYITIKTPDHEQRVDVIGQTIVTIVQRCELAIDDNIRH